MKKYLKIAILSCGILAVATLVVAPNVSQSPQTSIYSTMSHGVGG